MVQNYEHHIKIKEDKLCPFKVSTRVRARSCELNWHENIEIIIITDGEGVVRYGEERFFVRPHDIIVVNSDVIHCIESEGEISYQFIIIDESFCTENGIDVTRVIFKRCFTDSKVERAFFDTVEKHSEYKRVKEPIFATRLRLSVLSMLTLLCERHASVISGSREDGSPSVKFVKHTIEFINDHYTEQFSLDELASLAGVTKYHLAREFKRYTGGTVFTYVNVLRCKRAEHCIQDGMTVTEAAYESGFESLSYFSRTYKRIMGRSPSGIRRPDRS